MQRTAWDALDDLMAAAGFVAVCISCAVIVALSLGWEPPPRTTALLAAIGLLIGGNARVAAKVVLTRQQHSS